jgi:hypothetical protein
MTDYVLRSADQATMYAAFEAQGIYADGVLKTQGILSDGGAWCLVDQGSRTYVKGYTMDNEPIYATDEYWVPLRWNSGEPTPADQPGVDIVWQSDAEDPGEYPEGVTRFA